MKTVSRIMLVLVAVALASTAQQSAPWDGDHGDFWVGTLAQNTSMLGYGQSHQMTWFFIIPKNPDVNNVLISAKYRDDAGNVQTFDAFGERTLNTKFITVFCLDLPYSRIIGTPKITLRITTSVFTGDLSGNPSSAKSVSD